MARRVVLKNDGLSGTSTPNGFTSIGMDGTTVSKQVGATNSAIGGGGTLPYLIYRAILNQTGTDAPVATVYEDTIGNGSLGIFGVGSDYYGNTASTYPSGTIEWTRDSSGQYSGLLTGAFPTGKVHIIIGTSFIGWPQIGLWESNVDYLFLSSQNNNGTNNGGSYADNLIKNLPIEIKVYP